MALIEWMLRSQTAGRKQPRRKQPLTSDVLVRVQYSANLGIVMPVCDYVPLAFAMQIPCVR